MKEWEEDRSISRTLLIIESKLENIEYISKKQNNCKTEKGKDYQMT
jgi:hypothetical protein